MTGRAPDTKRVVVRSADKNVRIHWVPADTVHNPGVTREHFDGLLVLLVIDVNFVILTSGGNERFTHTTETAVKGVKSLSDPNIFSHEAPGVDVPEMETLSGDVEQSVLVGLVHREAHDPVLLLKDGDIGQIFEVVRANSMVRICSQDMLAICTEVERLNPDPFPRILKLPLGVAGEELAPVSSADDPRSVRGEADRGRTVLRSVRGAGNLSIDVSSFNVPNTDELRRKIGREKGSETFCQRCSRPRNSYSWA